MGCLVNLYLEKQKHKEEGTNLRERRRKMYINMDVMAKEVGISKNDLRAVEKGRHHKDRDLLYKLINEKLNSLALEYELIELKHMLRLANTQLAIAQSKGYKIRSII